MVGGEQRYTIRPNEVTGLFAYNYEGKFWIGVSYADDIRVEEFDPFEGRVISSWKPDVPVVGVVRFILFKDRFWLSDGSIISNYIFNPTATDKAVGNEITNIPAPSDTSIDFSRTTLFDFQDWVDFQYQPANSDPEQFKLVWSVQTGYFIINQNNRIVAHLYGNFTPYSKSTPARMSYLGNAYQGTDENSAKVYIPILRSGQTEVVNLSLIHI